MNFILRHPIVLLMLAGVLTLSYFVFAKVTEEDSGGGRGRFGGFGGTPLVGVSAVESRMIADDVESVGTTIANESVDLTAAVSETISRVNFEDGEFVEKGKILVELTSSAEATRLAEAQATVDDAERQMARLRDLSDSNLVADLEFDQARVALETAQARLEGVLVDMEDRLVRAPFSGYLGFRNVSEGSLLTPGTVISTLDDVSLIKLDFNIPEVYLADISVGQTIEAQSVVYDDRRFEGEVTVVGSRIDPVTRSVSVRAAIENDDMSLRPGMLLTVKLALNEERALVVPETSIITAQGQQFVFVVGAENRVERRQVELGRRRDGLIELISGVQPNERVVSDGTIRVRPGITVQIQGEEPAARPGGRPGGSGGRPAGTGRPGTPRPTVTSTAN